MSEIDTDGNYQVYWPRSARQSKLRPLARRLDSLAGKKVALLWDYVFRGDEVFVILEGQLKARYPGVSFVDWREFGNIHGTDERAVVAALPQRFKELGVQAAISAMGC